MTSFLFAVFSPAHLCLAVWLVRLALVRHSPHTWLVAAVAAGLVYGNGIVALGSTLGAGDLLHALSLPRFVIHALVTPLLIIFAAGAARDLGLAWARTRAAQLGFSLLAAVLIVYGVAVDLVGLTLVPSREGGVLHYSAAEATLPVPSVVTVVVLLLVGAALLLRARSGWMLLGAAIMFAVSAVPSAPLVVGNLGEVALITGLALTARHMGGWPAPSSGAGNRGEGQARAPGRHRDVFAHVRERGGRPRSGPCRGRTSAAGPSAAPTGGPSSGRSGNFGGP